jgi:dienelactone hydrolase
MNPQDVVCPARGQVGQGNVIVHGRTRRRYRCTVCNKTFSRRAASSRWRATCGRSAELAALTRLLADPACRLLTQQPDTHHLRLGYFGASTGAGAALVAAAERPNVVGAVVSRGGRPDLAGSDLARVRAPTLLIVGGHDLPVIKLNRAAFAQLCVEKRLAIIPAASHLFEEPGTLDEVARLAREWFTRYLAPTEARSGTANPSVTSEPHRS